MRESKAESGDLLRRAIQGDRVAFSRLLEERYDGIYRLAYRWTRQREEAEEITQEVCIKLARSIGEFRGDAALSTWIYGITLNAARDFQRRNRRAESREVDDPDWANMASGQPDPERVLLGGMILHCLSLLPDPLRMSVLLVHTEGLNHREAGRAQNCSEGTVSWRLSEARKRLADCLSEGA